jgi:hypothetical protein
MGCFGCLGLAEMVSMCLLQYVPYSGAPKKRRKKKELLTGNNGYGHTFAHGSLKGQPKGAFLLIRFLDHPACSFI